MRRAGLHQAPLTALAQSWFTPGTTHSSNVELVYTRHRSHLQRRAGLHQAPLTASGVSGAYTRHRSQLQHKAGQQWGKLGRNLGSFQDDRDLHILFTPLLTKMALLSHKNNSIKWAANIQYTFQARYIICIFLRIERNDFAHSAHFDSFCEALNTQ